MAKPLTWDDEHNLLGVQVRAWFFDAQAVDAQPDWVARMLPILDEVRPRSLHAEGERGSYQVGDLHASPDAVFVHGDGLICLSYRNGDRRPHEREHWTRQLRIDAMLQSIVAAMAVSGHCQRPTVALLRCHNVLYQFDPGPPVLECLASSIPAAKRYAGERERVSVQQLAAFCEPKLRVLPMPEGSELPPAQCDTGFADTTPSTEASGT